MSSGADFVLDTATVFIAGAVSGKKGTGLSSHQPETSVSGFGLRSSACTRLPCIDLAGLRRTSTSCVQSIFVHAAAAVGADFFWGARFFVCARDGRAKNAKTQAAQITKRTKRDVVDGPMNSE